MSQNITKQEAIETGAILVDGILLVKRIWAEGNDANRDQLVRTAANFVFDAVTRLQKMEDEKRKAWQNRDF